MSQARSSAAHHLQQRLPKPDAVESSESPGPGSAAPLAPFSSLPSCTQTSTWAGQRVPAGSQLTASWLAESNVGWGGAWPPASLAIGSRGTRLCSGEAGPRARASGSAGARTPRLPSPSRAPERASALARPLPLPQRLSAQNLLVWGDARTVLAAVVGSVWPGPDKRAGGAPTSPSRSPARAAAAPASPSRGGGGGVSPRTPPLDLPLSLRVRTELALRPERARGPPAGKAPRAPIRHGGRRRRQREEKVSRAAAFRGLAFFVSDPLPSPPASRAGLPRGPRRHLGAGGGSRGPSARRGWGLRPGHPPRAVAAQPAPRAYPAEPAGAEYAPRFCAFPPPVLRVSREKPAPGGPCARCQLPGVEADPGLPPPPPPPPGRLAEPRPPLPLYVRELLRGPEDANFLVCTCRFPLWWGGGKKPCLLQSNGNLGKRHRFKQLTVFTNLCLHHLTDRRAHTLLRLCICLFSLLKRAFLIVLVKLWPMI